MNYYIKLILHEFLFPNDIIVLLDLFVTKITNKERSYIKDNMGKWG